MVRRAWKCIEKEFLGLLEMRDKEFSSSCGEGQVKSLDERRRDEERIGRGDF